MTTARNRRSGFEAAPKWKITSNSTNHWTSSEDDEPSLKVCLYLHCIFADIPIPNKNEFDINATLQCSEVTIHPCSNAMLVWIDLPKTIIAWFTDLMFIIFWNYSFTSEWHFFRCWTKRKAHCIPTIMVSLSIITCWGCSRTNQNTKATRETQKRVKFLKNGCQSQK